MPKRTSSPQQRPDKPENVTVRSGLRVSSASPMVGLLKSAIGGMDSAGMIEQSLALAYWERVVGPQAAAASRAESVRDGILIVVTRSSVWSHELSLHRQSILTALNRLLGRPMIREILFRAQGVPSGPPAADPEIPDATELDAVVLPREEQARLSELLKSLEGTQPERLHHSLSVRMEREAKLRRWRINRGWLACSVCGAAFRNAAEVNPENRVCPVCRIER